MVVFFPILGVIRGRRETHMITSYTSSAIREAGFFVFGWTCLWSFSTTSEKTLSVDLWRLLTCAARTLSRNCPRETRRLSRGHVDGAAVA